MRKAKKKITFLRKMITIRKKRMNAFLEMIKEREWTPTLIARRRELAFSSSCALESCSTRNCLKFLKTSFASWIACSITTNLSGAKRSLWSRSMDCMDWTLIVGSWPYWRSSSVLLEKMMLCNSLWISATTLLAVSDIVGSGIEDRD